MIAASHARDRRARDCGGLDAIDVTDFQYAVRRMKLLGSNGRARRVGRYTLSRTRSSSCQDRLAQDNREYHQR